MLVDKIKKTNELTEVEAIRFGELINSNLSADTQEKAKYTIKDWMDRNAANPQALELIAKMNLAKDYFADSNPRVETQNGAEEQE